MHETAQDLARTRVLLVGFESYLSINLAKSLIARNCLIYAIARQAPQDLLNDRHFTLLDIDPNQPLPQYLPHFDMIFYLQKENYLRNDYLKDTQSVQVQNLASLTSKSNSKVFLILSIKTSQHFLENLPRHKNLEIMLIGDIYGPGDNFDKGLDSENPLKNLISQALKSDKIILQNEGQTLLYPTYVTDAVFAINKFAFDRGSKRIRIIVSQKPVKSLDAAYEIQSQIGLILNKQIDLFFLDEGKHITREVVEPVINFSDLSYLPKIKIEEGLKEIFEKFNLEGKDQKEESVKEIKRDLDVSKNFTKSQKLPKFPTFSLPNIISKKFLILAIFVFLAISIKISVDYYQGLKAFKKAAQSLQMGDFKMAESQAQYSAKKIETANGPVITATNLVKPLAKNKIIALQSLAEGSLIASRSIESFASGADSLTKSLKVLTSQQSQDQTVDFDYSATNFQKAYFLSLQAKELIKAAKEQKILASHIDSLENSLSIISQTSIFANDLSNLVPQITGSKEKSYVVLVMDNRILRPGGGQIKTFGTIDFEDGKLKNISFVDITTLDNNIKGKIVPPKPLSEKLAQKQLLFKDSNFDLDFQKDAKIFQDMYQNQTGKQIDGVLAFDVTFLETLLKITGPITQEGQKTDENLKSADNGQKLADVTLTIFNKLLQDLEKSTTSQNQNATFFNYISNLKQAFVQKHIQVTFKDQALASFVLAKSLSNILPPIGFDPANDREITRDFIAISEANLTNLPINNQIEREINYKVNVSSEASIESKLNLTYKNSSDKDYLAYIALNTPTAATLSDFKIANISKIKEIVTQKPGSLSVFSTYIEIPASSEQIITFAYNLGKNIKLEQGPTYHLFVQKQPGIKKDNFNFSFSLPQNIKIDSVNGDHEYKNKQNIIIETDTLQDREYQILLAKN